MALVPTDFPSRLAAAGLSVQVLDGWESRGSSADHRAVVFHWTASSPSESPSSCANYCFLGAQYAPDYNVLCDRTGVVWVGAREKANSSGDISSVALNEALRGQTDWRSAASRGLSDDTSANSSLFAISAQNNGTGEPWSDALVHAMATCAAVALQCLGLGSSGYVTHHAALTRRKIDLTAGTGGCPDGGTWNRLVTDALGGGGAWIGDDDVLTNDDKAWFKSQMLDIVRKEAISGAADGNASSVPEVTKSYVLDVVRKEGISGAADGNHSSVPEATVEMLMPALEAIAEKLGVTVTRTAKPQVERPHGFFGWLREHLGDDDDES